MSDCNRDRLDEDGSGLSRRDDRKKKRGGSYAGKAKRVVLSPFKKAKKQLQRENDDRRSPSGNDRKRVGVLVRGSQFCLCFKQSPTLDSIDDESPTSDPNSSGFTFESLRALIEKNDFFSNECNTHLDVNDENL